MVRHPAVGVNTVTETGDALANQFLENVSVLIVKKDRLSGIAAEHDVIDSAGDVDAGFSGHEAKPYRKLR